MTYFQKALAGFVSIFAFAATTVAQEDAGGALEEVVVTAQKREQSLQDVPISITAFTGAELVDRGINQIDTLDEITPNMRIQSGAGVNGNIPVFSLRGVGFQTDPSTVSSSPVAVHVNEVPYPYPVVATGLLFDMDRVEVLRGPQGDLFGLNTTAGTVNFITARPTEDFFGSVLLEYGEFDSTKLEGVVSGSLSDNVRARLAVSHDARGEGWQTNFLTGQKLGEMERTGFRATLEADLTDSFSATLIGHAYDEDSDAYGVRPLSTTYGLLWWLLPDPTDVTAGSNVNGTTSWGSNVFYPGQTPFIKRQGAGGSLRLDWDLGNTTLTSITGFEQFDREDSTDADGSDRLLFDYIFQTDLEMFSTELRLASNTDNAVSWLVGASYADDTTHQTSAFDLRDEALYPGIAVQAPIQKRDITAVFGHMEWALNDRWTLIGGLRYTEENRSQTQQGTFQAGDGSDLIALLTGFQPGPTLLSIGDTLTSSRVPGDTSLPTDGIVPCLAGIVCQPGTVGGYSDAITYDDWSGKIGLNFFVNDDWMLYGSFSRGFKSGGFADLAAAIRDNFVPTKAEYLNAFELGAKGTINDQLRLNTSVFYYDYEDQQVVDNIVDPIIGPILAIVNAPESEVYGFEVEAHWVPTDNLTIIQNLGYSHGEFKTFNRLDFIAVFDQANDPNWNGIFTPVFQDAAGLDIGFPEVQYYGAFIYDTPVGSGNLSTRFTFDYSYQSETNLNQTWVGFVDPTETGSTDVDAYWIANARISLLSENSWELTLFGDNIFDEEYEQYRQAAVNSSNIAVDGMPRTWGIRFRKDFQ